MVSVILNSYKDDQSQLREAIIGYQTQAVPCEIILSTVRGDLSVETGKQMGVDIIHAIQTPGIYKQLNSAIQRATGDWFCYSSGNDKALSFKLKDELNMVLKTSKLVCYSAFYITNSDFKIKAFNKFHPYCYEKHLRGNFVTDVSMVNMTLLRKYLPFREEYGNYAFWDMWLRIYEGEGNVFAYNPIPNYLYCVDGTGRHSLKRKNNKMWNEDELFKEKMLNSHGVEYKPRLKMKRVLRKNKITGEIVEKTIPDKTWRRILEVPTIFGANIEWSLVTKKSSPKKKTNNKKPIPGKKKDLVTVIMNTYNDNEKYLRDAISGYKNQKMKCELIVSTIIGDPGIEIAKSMGVDKVVINKAPGLCGQINNALEYANGGWFCVASGNDKALPNKISDEYTLLMKTGKKVCYSAFHLGDKNLKIKGIYKSHPYSYNKNLRGNFIIDNAMTDMDLILQNFPLKQEFGNFIFWDLWLRIHEKNGNVFIYNPRPNFIYRLDGEGRHYRKNRDAKLWNYDEVCKVKMLASHGVKYKPKPFK